MRTFLPFKAILPNPRKADELPYLVTPLMDELNLHLRQKLVTRHQHNFVRFASFRELPGDKNSMDQTERARLELEECFKRDYLLRDEKSSYFLMDSRQNGLTVTGFIGMFGLDSTPAPSRFEAPLDLDVRDRLRQIENLRVQTAPITMGYVSDENRDGALTRLMASTRKNQPLSEIETPEGHRIRVWRVVEKNHDLEASLSHRAVFILDGEDRWKAATAYAHEMREADPAPSPLRTYNYVMTWLIPMNNDDSVILRPMHRALKKGAARISSDKLLEMLEDYFEIERYQFSHPGAKEAELVNIIDEMEFIGKLQHTYGLYIGDKSYYLLFLRDVDAYEKMIESTYSRYWKRLDINVLHAIVFQDMLGIGWNTPEDLEKITPIVDPKNGVDLVDEGFADAFFLLNAPSTDQLLDFARASEELPPRALLLKGRPLVGPIMSSIDPHVYVDDNE